jgi:hypothetical protein
MVNMLLYVDDIVLVAYISVLLQENHLSSSTGVSHEGH